MALSQFERHTSDAILERISLLESELSGVKASVNNTDLIEAIDDKLACARFNTSSPSGAFEWILEKISSSVLVVTSVYILVMGLFLIRNDYGIDAFFTGVINIAILIIFLCSAFSLAFLRGKTVMEDYVSGRGMRLFCISALFTVNAFLFATSFIAVLYIHFVSSLLKF